jgi:Flp pilus assembly pilin Flp
MNVSSVSRVGRPRRLVRGWGMHAWISASELTRGRPGTRRDDHGATAVEYGLMVSLIAVVIVISVSAFGHNVSDLYRVPASIFNP